jgi:hypothetical protein
MGLRLDSPQRLDALIEPHADLDRRLGRSDANELRLARLTSALALPAPPERAALTHQFRSPLAERVLERPLNLLWTSASHARAHHGALSSSPQVLERSYAATAAATRLLARPPPYSEDFLGVEDDNSIEGDEDEDEDDSDDDDDDDDDNARRRSARSPPYARPSTPYVSCGASPALTTALTVSTNRSVAGAEAAAKDAVEAAEAATQAAREVTALAAFLRADATLGGGGRTGSPGRAVHSPGRAVHSHASARHGASPASLAPSAASAASTEAKALLRPLRRSRRAVRAGATSGSRSAGSNEMISSSRQKPWTHGSWGSSSS